MVFLINCTLEKKPSTTKTQLKTIFLNHCVFIIEHTLQMELGTICWLEEEKATALDGKSRIKRSGIISLVFYREGEAEIFLTWVLYCRLPSDYSWCFLFNIPSFITSCPNSDLKDLKEVFLQLSDFSWKADLFSLSQ